MRVLLIIFLFTSSFCASQELSDLRARYPKANLQETVTDALFEDLSLILKKDDKILVAYKGAVATLKAKYAKGFLKKKSYFKQGAELLEYAIAEAPKNIEIRCLRLSVQENSPRIVGYKKNIKEDKQFLLDHYTSNTDTEVKKFVKGYVLISNVFTDAEKQLF